MRLHSVIRLFGTPTAFRALPLGLFILLGATAAPACQNKAAPEPSNDRPVPEKSSAALEGAERSESSPAAAKRTTGSAATASTARKTQPVPTTPGDPVKGQFTLEDATKGLPGSGALQATIQTDLGDLKCELYEDKAPITVANFVGLARGTRPWKKGGEWVRKPLYDGTVFHRVVKGFMIQGGDPNGNGTGGPGYEIPDEIWPGAKHDERGLLCMANRGKDTNGSQFFIMDGKAAHLDGGYTIFGKCGPDSLIEKLASVKVQGQKAVNPTQVKTVQITRAK